MNKSDPLSILNEVRRLEIVTRGSVDTLLKGFYKSTFPWKGFGIPPGPGVPSPEDDFRTIDWNVTAPPEHSLREKPSWKSGNFNWSLAVDLAASIWYGTGPLSKRETALRLLRDPCIRRCSTPRPGSGLMVFTDRVEYYIPPKRGKAATMRVLRELIKFQPVGKRTNYKAPFQMLSRILKRRSVLILVSDFTEPIPMESASVLAQRHDLVAAVIKDPLETNFKLPARVAVQDPESGKVGCLSPGSSAALRKANEFRENQLWGLTPPRAPIVLTLRRARNVVAALMRVFQKTN